MTLTRQHFELIADVLKATHPHNHAEHGMDDEATKVRVHQWQRERAEWIKRAKAINPRFDTKRFIVAATPQDALQTEA